MKTTLRNIVAVCSFLLGGCAIALSAQERADNLSHPSDFLSVTEVPGGLAAADLSSWQELAPEVKEIEIESSADGSAQKAMFYDPGSPDEKPLLLVLHSWSTDYLQNIDIPLAQFAVANGWAFMHPDFRGENDGRPQSTASELVIADMEDALEYARENAQVDSSRIYLLGYSGGAMNAMHLAARHPDVFAGIAAWVPVYDLVAWHEWNATQDEKYAGEIAGACGGEPREGTDAHEECVKRSPKSVIPDVAGQLRIFIAHGIDDDVVPPAQGLHAFNDVAKQEDRISQEHIDYVTNNREVPEALAARSQHESGDFPEFSEAGGSVLLHLLSGPAELVLFEGEHDMLYRPGLNWLARQTKQSE